MSELTHRVGLERLQHERNETVTAAPGELQAIAARLDIPGVLALRCDWVLRPGSGGAVEARGRLRARVVQTCVVTVEPFEADVADDFAVRFVPEGAETDDPDPDAVDEIPYAGEAIDLGEATVEQLALALDPYPRKPGAALPEGLNDAPESPFAALLRPE